MRGTMGKKYGNQSAKKSKADVTVKEYIQKKPICRKELPFFIWVLKSNDYG